MENDDVSNKLGAAGASLVHKCLYTVSYWLLQISRVLQLDPGVTEAIQEFQRKAFHP